MANEFKWLNEANHARPCAETRTEFIESELQLDQCFSEVEAKLDQCFTDFLVEFKRDIARLEAKLAWQMLATVLTLLGVLVSLGERFLKF